MPREIEPTDINETYGEAKIKSSSSLRPLTPEDVVIGPEEVRRTALTSTRFQESLSRGEWPGAREDLFNHALQLVVDRPDSDEEATANVA